eukprot:CAMPEP_0179109534 /NCGR_PEP_ID=MMETSP0796-20121207/51076_1 /TAXON_ID=73915 /ORGANISM="Pyrodinium bahamense, Strain pbaha01" /LENGTH=74 /DNA_ID=CAMNT_0020807641 /DNA_START=1551 /DNA_END=1772 /DNA_ORIENTATION=-
MEHVHEVGVGLAIVRFAQRLLHDQADHQLQLFGGRHFDLCYLRRNEADVLRAHLVQRGLHLAAERRLLTLGSRD